MLLLYPILQTKINFTDLPLEIVSMISNQVQVKDLGNLMLVNSVFLSSMSEEQLEKKKKDYLKKIVCDPEASVKRMFKLAVARKLSELREFIELFQYSVEARKAFMKSKYPPNFNNIKVDVFTLSTLDLTTWWQTADIYDIILKYLFNHGEKRSFIDLMDTVVRYNTNDFLCRDFSLEIVKKGILSTEYDQLLFDSCFKKIGIDSPSYYIPVLVQIVRNGDINTLRRCDDYLKYNPNIRKRLFITGSPVVRNYLSGKYHIGCTAVISTGERYCTKPVHSNNRCHGHNFGFGWNK